MPSVYSGASPFIDRHNGPDPGEVSTMLGTVRANSLDDLIEETVPSSLRMRKELDLPDVLSEQELLSHMKELADENGHYKTFIGLGYYRAHTPAVIQRCIFENPSWYTAYTPYQAEISQGRLEALLNYQTVITDLTQMDVANASLLDEGTAAAEAITLLHRVASRDKREVKPDHVFVSSACLPQTIDILRGRLEPLGLKLVVDDVEKFTYKSHFFAALLQYPDANGHITDIGPIIDKAHKNNIYVAVATDLMALTLLKPPGEMGADVVVGNSQRLGVPMGFGGPHAAFIACRDTFQRQLPGRIIGVTKDKHGKEAYRMALQTREQHIRREKATSNICTAQALLAVMAGMYAVYHGPDGLKRIATAMHRKAGLLANKLEKAGYTLTSQFHVDTLTIDPNEEDPETIAAIKQACEATCVNLRWSAPGIKGEHYIGISIDECTSMKDLDTLISIFYKAKGLPNPVNVQPFQLDKIESCIPKVLRRQSPFLQYPVFNKYHTETELMRYITKLERKDLGLNVAMIPLGSCTMKLNPAASLQPISHPGFSQVHPFVPMEQVPGYLKALKDLEHYLATLTGFDACSLQPNSGAQGEFAGLMAIRAYHRDRGDNQRNVALITASAHGTNPASAAMAGMDVQVVKCNAKGTIDFEDLKEKVAANAETLAALMITYPSTHGVFDEHIDMVIDIIHRHGGQVYMDGANLNAQLGLTSPGYINADVCHVNLHKTFAIPHGGGGPGMGPICVKAHLADYLPGSVMVPETMTPKSIPAISAAPWGSGSILLISYAFIRVLGQQIIETSKIAILNANYIKTRLEKHFDVLFQGKRNRVAHELILDFRSFKKSANITVTDIAKRLMDYGFHAPTVSFPVVGTLMIEPTESESKEEMDRFCDAMIAIRDEIRQIESGEADITDNVIKNAPHTQNEVTANTWEHSYSREVAAFPKPEQYDYKFWPSVGRLDEALGDRNLICTCQGLMPEYA